MTPNEPSNQPPTVLVVDDEKEVADGYAEMLRAEYDVITVYGGKEALERIDTTVDVVLLDRRMPDRHGDEVLAEIRARELHCRVVMVTAIEPDIDLISLDFDEYLVKPVSPATMRDAVDRMVARATLDVTLQEAFSLATKMATLEAKMDIEELESSEAYAELESEFADYRDWFAQITPDDDLYAQLSTTKMEALFANR